MTDNNKPPPPPGYPKDVESGGQTAASQPQYPGGYPTTGTAAAAGGYPAGPGSYPQVPAAGTSGAAPSGDGAYGYQQQPQPLYPGQQQPGPHPPVWGVPAMPPVLGDRASFVYAHPMWGPDDHTRDSRFVCCAWVCFLLGFFFPIFWLISVLLPCCLPGRAVRQAALASCIASIVYAILAIILAPSMSARYGGHHHNMMGMH